MTNAENAFLTAWITREDVNRYRRNQMNASDFKGRIHYQLAESETNIDTDIDILSEIFNRAMSGTSFWNSFSNNGIYIDGLGALMFMDLPQFYGTDLSAEDIFMLGGKKNAVVVSPGRRTTGNKKGTDDKDTLKEVEDELFDLLASYGHTLGLKPQEKIVLNVNMGQLFMTFTGESNNPSRLILQLKKKDLDDYNTGLITLTDLRKKLIRQTY